MAIHNWPKPPDVRRTIRNGLRSLVTGEVGRRTMGELTEREDNGWFADASPIRVVHADASMFPGAVAALLLQSLHPLAMAAVADHSGFRADPWGRVQRTGDFLARTVFGSSRQAAEACATVRAVHDHIHGTAPDGRPYSANDPHLLEWVHVAELTAFMAAHRVYGSTRLSPDDYDRYVADAARVARELGAVDVPHDVASLEQRLANFRPELVGTPAARFAARFLARPPQLPAMARLPYGAVFAAGVSLLPAWARFELRLPVFPVSERFVVRPMAAQVLDVLRWATAPDAPDASGAPDVDAA